MGMIKIYGVSDDLIEIDGSVVENEIGCNFNDAKARIYFGDGTIIRVYYSKPDCAVWGIEVERKGFANQTLQICDDEDADVYSDVFEIDSEIINYKVL